MARTYRCLVVRPAPLCGRLPAGDGTALNGSGTRPVLQTKLRAQGNQIIQRIGARNRPPSNGISSTSMVTDTRTSYLIPAQSTGTPHRHRSMVCQTPTPESSVNGLNSGHNSRIINGRSMVGSHAIRRLKVAYNVAGIRFDVDQNVFSNYVSLSAPGTNMGVAQ